MELCINNLDANKYEIKLMQIPIEQMPSQLLSSSQFGKYLYIL